MSELADKIKADMLTARKARDTFTVKALSTLYGEVEGIAKKKNEPISDELVVATVKKFLANLKESEGQTGRLDLLGAIRSEIELLEQYVPQQMDEDELRALLTAENPANIGAAMQFLKANYAGLYDGKMASQVAREVTG